MIEITIADTTWYGVSRVFPTGGEARAAFVALGQHDRDGSLNVGVYRHQRVGLDSEPVLVSIVGIEPEKVAAAAKLIEGEEVEQHPDTWLSLIARRARVVLDLYATGARSGHYEMPHGKEGERLGPDGTFDA